MTTTAPLRFAVIGAGVIGAVHARAIAELPGQAELVAVADIDADRAAALAAQHGSQSTSDVADLWRRADIDAVTVAVPSGLHAEIAVPALAAGKHVVIEKPIDVSLAAADRIIGAEQGSPGLATIISQHRFDRSTVKVQDAVRNGRLGRLTSGIASHAWWRGQSYYDSGQWRGTWDLDGGGAIMNQSIHTVDLMLSVLGAPVEVFAYTACLAHQRIEVEDTAVAVVRFESGALGLIHGTTAAYPGLDASLRIFGTKGSAVISDDELVFFHATDGSAQEIRLSHLTGANQVSGDDAITTQERSLGGAHRTQLADFVEAVRGGRQPRVSTQTARTALEVVLAIYRSAATGSPVRIDPPGGNPSDEPTEESSRQRGPA